MMNKNVTKRLFILSILSLIFLFGCTPEKAKTLKTGAAVFSNQAMLAIESVSTAIDSEVIVPTLPEPGQTELFVKNILEYQSSPQSLNDFNFLIHASKPYEVEIDSKANNKKQQFILRMRKNYHEFNEMFRSIETGSVLATAAVGKTLKHAQTLVADMVAIAKAYQTSPIMLIGQRNDLLSQVGQVLSDSNLTKVQKEARLVILKAERDRILKEEDTLQRNLIESCVKAVAAGLEFQKMIQGYEKLQISDLQNTLLRAVGLIGSLTGKDYSNLLKDADVFFDKAKNDPYISTAVNKALEELNSI